MATSTCFQAAQIAISLALWPALTLRANRLRATREDVQRQLASEGVETEPAHVAPDGLTVTAGNPLRRPADGLFVVQDEASQLVAMAVGARPGDRVLDLCAAPGGKTTAIAAALADRGVIVASDVRPRRLQLLREAVRVSGASHAHVVQVPARGPLPFGTTFDRVLVDAPCSGLGTIRRDPDIRWRREEASLATLASAQLELLTRASDTVAPGGRLVYATCSSEPDENEQVADLFLDRHDDFAVEAIVEPVLAPFTDSRGMFRTLPFEHGLEAFFAVVLVRRPA